MLTLMAGPSGIRQSGETFDTSTEEAKALIAGGYAVEAKPGEEVAVAPAKPEAATRKGGRKAAKPEADAADE